MIGDASIVTGRDRSSMNKFAFYAKTKGIGIVTRSITPSRRPGQDDVVDQFATVKPGATLRSVSQRLTVVWPRLNATAAMSLSIVPIGRPIGFRTVAIRPYSSAAD